MRFTREDSNILSRSEAVPFFKKIKKKGGEYYATIPWARRAGYLLNHLGRFSPGVLPLSSSSHEETEVPKDTLRQRYKLLTPGERSHDLAGIHALILGMSRERWIADP